MCCSEEFDENGACMGSLGYCESPPCEIHPSVISDEDTGLVLLSRWMKLLNWN